MADGPSVAWLGHSTVVIDVDGARLISDPLLQKHNGPLRRRFPLDEDQLWQGADAVLLSHLHHDHAEVGSLRKLGRAPIYTADANAVWARSKGLNGVGLGDEWVKVPTTDVEVHLTKAIHGHRPMPHRPNAANGHLIRAPGFTAWVVGDTSLYPEMSSIGALAGGDIDLIAVPIAGWGPKLSGGHLGPEEAAKVVAMSGARYALAVHWGSLRAPFMHHYQPGWMDKPFPEFAAAVRREAPATEVIHIWPGELWRPT